MKRGGRSRSVPALSVLLFCCCGAFWLGVAAEAQAAQSSNSKEPISIVATKLDYYDKEQKLVYSGHVVAVRGATTLKTPLLVVFLSPKAPNAAVGPPSSANQVRRMEASGPVTIISKDQIATGDFGIYEKAENKIYLNGNVSLAQGPNVTTGDHIVYDVNSGQAVVTGHVRSMFTPNSEPDNGSKKNSIKTSGAGTPEPQTQ